MKSNAKPSLKSARRLKSLCFPITLLLMIFLTSRGTANATLYHYSGVIASSFTTFTDDKQIPYARVGDTVNISVEYDPINNVASVVDIIFGLGYTQPQLAQYANLAYISAPNIWSYSMDSGNTIWRMNLNEFYYQSYGWDGLAYANASCSPVPEPSTLLLLGGGLAGLAYLRRVQRTKRSVTGAPSRSTRRKTSC